MLIFILMGLAVGFSPRAGISVVVLFLILFIFAFKSIPAHRLFATFFLGGLIILVPTLLQAMVYGFGDFYFWVYKFSAGLYPGFSPLTGLLHLLLGSLPIVLCVLLFLYFFITREKLRQRRSVWMVFLLAIANFWGLWAGSRPYIQQFLMAIPFLGLLAGIGYEYAHAFVAKRFDFLRWNWAGLILLAGLSLTGWKSYQLWTAENFITLTKWKANVHWLLDHTEPGATFAGGTAYYQPIARPDAFYYWFAGTYVTPTMRHLEAEFEPYDFEDLRNASPDILHESFAESWGFGLQKDYRIWLRENYRLTPCPRYWLKK